MEILGPAIYFCHHFPGFHCSSGSLKMCPEFNSTPSPYCRLGKEVLELLEHLHTGIRVLFISLFRGRKCYSTLDVND